MHVKSSKVPVASMYRAQVKICCGGNTSDMGNFACSGGVVLLRVCSIEWARARRVSQ